MLLASHVHQPIQPQLQGEAPTSALRTVLRAPAILIKKLSSKVKNAYGRAMIRYNGYGQLDRERQVFFSNFLGSATGDITWNTEGNRDWARIHCCVTGVVLDTLDTGLKFSSTSTTVPVDHVFPMVIARDGRLLYYFQNHLEICRSFPMHSTKPRFVAPPPVAVS